MSDRNARCVQCSATLVPCATESFVETWAIAFLLFCRSTEICLDVCNRCRTLARRNRNRKPSRGGYRRSSARLVPRALPQAVRPPTRCINTVLLSFDFKNCFFVPQGEMPVTMLRRRKRNASRKCWGRCTSPIPRAPFACVAAPTEAILSRRVQVHDVTGGTHQTQFSQLALERSHSALHAQRRSLGSANLLGAFC